MRDAPLAMVMREVERLISVSGVDGWTEMLVIISVPDCPLISGQVRRSSESEILKDREESVTFDAAQTNNPVPSS